MNETTRHELEVLLSALCDGGLDAPAAARLEELLAVGPENRQYYLEYLDVHARLLRHPTVAESPSHIEPARPATRSGSRWRMPVLTHSAVALAGMAVAFLVLGVPAPVVDSHRFTPAQSTEYVATLTKLSNCVWDRPGEPLREGSRLLPGQLRLTRGVASIHFDSGTRMILEAPAVLQVHSEGSATLVSGKMVFRGDETALPFDLRTPASTLMDIGTEYAVLVDGKHEEVHVFEGEVQRSSHNGDLPDQNLKAGEARTYDADNDLGKPTALDSPHFVRLSPDDLNADPVGGLRVYEGFDYKDADAIKAGKADGGAGWNGPWINGLMRPFPGDMPDRHNLNVLDGLNRFTSSTPPVGGRFEYAGFTKAFRRLAQPIRLDRDGVYFLSYLFQPEGPPVDPTNAVGVLFWPEADGRRMEGDSRKRLNIGVGGANHLFTHMGEASCRVPLPLTYGETYLLVAKIVAGAKTPDQVFVRVYGTKDPVDDAEGGWTVAGPQFRSDAVFDWLQLHVNSGKRQAIDELRLGTTWSSVTSPWVLKAKEKK